MTPQGITWVKVRGMALMGGTILAAVLLLVNFRSLLLHPNRPMVDPANPKFTREQIHRQQIYRRVFNRRYLEESGLQPAGTMAAYNAEKMALIHQEFDPMSLDELLEYGRRELDYDGVIRTPAWMIRD